MNVTGSPQKKKNGKSWYAVLSIPGGDGKKHQKWVSLNIPTAKGNKRKAQEACAKLVAEMNGAQVVYSAKILFADWLEKWLVDKEASGTISAITLQSYKIYANKSAVPYFRKRGTVLQDMRRRDVQDYYNYLTAKGLSGKSVKDYSVVIRGALNAAVDEDIIAFSPADRAKLPKVQKPEHNFYTAEQVQNLLVALKGDALYTPVFLAVNFGLRREECLGLEWSAVDLENKTLTVRKTITKLTEEVINDGTKTPCSRRIIPIPDRVLPFFCHLKAKQAEERLKLGADYQDRDDDWVCRHPDGKRLSVNKICHGFADFIKKHNLPKVTFHELRHSFASILVSQGADLKRVQELMGHADFATTANLYAHLTVRDKLDALDTLCEAIQVPS